MAPDGSLTDAPPAPDGSENKNSQVNTKALSNQNEVNAKTDIQEENKGSDDDEDDEPEPDTILFVKNLNFSTSPEDFKKV